MITIKEAIEQINPPSLVKKFVNINNKISKEDMLKIIDKGDKISDKIINNPGKISLILGQVQSGKTMNFLSIISHLFDKGSNFVFVAPATDNLLLEQTVTRIENTFPSSKVKVFKINEFKKGREYDFSKLTNSLKDGNKVILLSLKHEMRLKDSQKAIKIAKNKINLPVFIDDEGDQSSFNNGVDKDSKVYKEIINVYKSLEKMSMLTVTASPMPHIFVSPEYKIKPDFAFYTPPGSQYLGISQFMDDDEKFLRIVNSRDNESFFDKNGKALPLSFKKAIASFFAASAWIHIKNDFFENQSMLLHVDRSVSKHQKILKVTENFMRSFKKDLMIKKQKTMEILQEVMIDLKIDLEPETFAPLIIEHISNSEALVVNGYEIDNETISKLYEPKRKNYIFIGSSMLQRGVTIPNLLHTYFTYRGGNTLNADTVLQRARWFGYRKNISLIRLYMSEIAIVDFRALAVAVPEMIDKIKEIQNNNLSFKEIERSLLLPYANMKATRDSVIFNKRSKLSSFLTDANINSSNAAESLFKELKKTKTNKVMKGQPFYGINFYSYLEFKDWVTPDILKEIYKEVVPNRFDKKALEDFIEFEKPNIFVVNMVTEENEYRERTVANGTISISQGRNDNYVGDRYWYKDPSGIFSNSLIFQLFKVKIDSGDIIFKIAISSTNRIHGHYVHAIDK